MQQSFLSYPLCVWTNVGVRAQVEIHDNAWWKMTGRWADKFFRVGFTLVNESTHRWSQCDRKFRSTCTSSLNLLFTLFGRSQSLAIKQHRELSINDKTFSRSYCFYSSRWSMLVCSTLHGLMVVVQYSQPLWTKPCIVDMIASVEVVQPVYKK